MKTSRKFSGMIKGLIFLALLLLVGCTTTNPFCEFYQDRTGGIDISTSPKAILPTGEPKIYSGSDADADGQKMAEDGYELLGVANFNSGNVSESQIIAQAKQVKAETVFFYSRYTNTISGSIPLTLPKTQTVITNSSGTGFTSGNIYGGRGSASYSGSGSWYGSSTSTIYGTETTNIPYSENRYDYFATFWIKTKKPIFGVFVNNFSVEFLEKWGKELRNTKFFPGDYKGVLVTTVRKDSPAFMADVRKGDILRKINDTETNDAKTFSELLPKFAGQTVSVELVRGYIRSITKQIKLNTLNEQPQAQPTVSLPSATSTDSP